MSDFVTDERENPHNGPASPVGEGRGDEAASNNEGQGGAGHEGLVENSWEEHTAELKSP